MSPWAGSVPHCCGAVAARAVPAKPFYPCRNKGSLCLPTGAQLSPGGMQQVTAVPGVLLVLLGPQHRALNTPSAFEVTHPSQNQPGRARTAEGVAGCIPRLALAQERDRRAGPHSGGTFPKERSWNRRDFSLKAFLFLQALLKGAVRSRGEFRQI